MTRHLTRAFDAACTVLAWAVIAAAEAAGWVQDRRVARAMRDEGRAMWLEGER